MGRYFIYKDCQILGPYDRGELAQAGPLRPETLVSEEGGSGRELDWRSAEEVSELSGVYLPSGATLSALEESLHGSAPGLLERIELESLGVPGYEEGAGDWISKVLEDAELKRLFGVAPATEELKDLGEARDRIRGLNAQLEALQARLLELERRPSASRAAAAPPPAASAEPPVAAPPPAAVPPPPAEEETSGGARRFQFKRPGAPEEGPAAPPRTLKFGAGRLQPLKREAPAGETPAVPPAGSVPPPGEEAPAIPPAASALPPSLPAEAPPAEEGKTAGRTFKFTRKAEAPPSETPAAGPPRTMKLSTGRLQPLKREAPAEGFGSFPAAGGVPPLGAPTPAPPPPLEVAAPPPLETLAPPPLAVLPPAPMEVTAAPPAPTLGPGSFPPLEAPATMAFSVSPAAAPPATPPAFTPAGPTIEPPAAEAPALPGGAPTPGTQEVIARLAKPAPPPQPAAPPKKKGLPIFIVGSAVLLIGLVTAFFFFLRDPKDVKTMINMGEDQQPLGAEPPPEEPPPAPQAQQPQETPAAAPAPAPEAAAPAPAPAPVEPVPDPGAGAIELVKKYPLDGDRGSVAQWLQFSFMANPGDGNQEEWTAGAVEASTYLVQYRLMPGAQSKLKAPITYLFEADTSRRTVKGSNPAARELMGGPPRIKPATPRRAPVRKARAPRKGASAPSGQVPLLPLPTDSDLLPPAEDDAEFRKDTIHRGG